MKFLSNAELVEGWGIVTRSVVIASWVVLGAALACYLFGVRLKPRQDVVVRSQPIAAVIVLVAMGWLCVGLTGRRLGELDSFLPPRAPHVTATPSANGELGWIMDDYQGALAQARVQHKPVLIDFTGYTCTNCRWMEANMFPREQVQDALERFVRVRLFTDGNDGRDRSQGILQQETFGTSALPLYAIVDSLGHRSATFLGMTRSTDEFVQFLVSGSGMQ
jgi:thiol:disulfide interchange protein DsbD